MFRRFTSFPTFHSVFDSLTRSFVSSSSHASYSSGSTSAFAASRAFRIRSSAVGILSLAPLLWSWPSFSTASSPASSASASSLPSGVKASKLIVAAACEIPHPDKTRGEDAYFIQLTPSATRLAALGVADGVGGWSAQNVDSGAYSRLLMCGAAASASNDPVALMDAGWRNARVLGSSTAIVAVFTQDTVRWANLGDSGLMLIRDGHMLIRTREQQHYFNCPLQLSLRGSDTPSHADCGEINTQVGDILIMGSDGLFDNLFDEQIVDTVREFVEPSHQVSQSTLQQLANQLAQSAVKYGARETGMSPFSVAARKAGKRYAGGKTDDVTVVCAQVQQPNNDKQQSAPSQKQNAA